MSDFEAKVAAVVSDSHVAFNAGRSDDVSLDDTVQLFKVVDIEDPDTKELLGTVSMPKLNLKIIHIQDKLSVGLVTDQMEDDGPVNPLLRVRRTKRVTTSHMEEDNRHVLVTIGERARIKRKNVKDKFDDEPPF